MIARIYKNTGSARLVSYLLKPTKTSQIIEASVYTPLINKLIAHETVILDPAVRSTVSSELNQAFDMINSLNPKVRNNMMHLIIGFDPEDGELSSEFKGQIARDVIDQMGFSNTYWVAVNHDRDDCEHGYVHDHDHIHILAARVGTNSKTIPDSWDYPKVNKVLRNVEQHYHLNPFVPFFEREYTTPEMHWVMHPEEEILQPERSRQKQYSQSI
jgi:hypothetical protein